MTKHEAMRQAIEEVYPGAELVDSDAILDHLLDRGYEVTLAPAARRAAEERGAVDELPLASTTSLGKRRSA